MATVAETLEGLAVRCEAASGPDRELDVAVGLAALGWQWVDDDFSDGQFLDFGAANMVGWREGSPVPDCIPSPTGCSEIAAAVMPDGMDYVIESVAYEPVFDEDRGKSHAAVRQHRWMDSPLHRGEGFAATPALALCAAALRAAAAKAREVRS